MYAILPRLFPFALPLLLIVHVTATAAQQSACSLTAGSAAPAIHFPYEGDEAEILSAQVVDYLNAAGSPDGLKAALEASAIDDSPYIYAEVYSGDFTGDDSDDVLTLIDWSWGAGFDLILSLYTCTGQVYVHRDTTHFDAISPVSSDAGTGHVVSAADLNANHIPDIVVQKPTVEGMKVHETLDIYEWDGEQLAQTFRLGPNYGGYSHILFSNWDNDPTTLEMTVGYFYAYEQETASAFIEYSFIRPIDMRYRWNGHDYARVCQHFTDDPTLRLAILHSAETLRGCGLNDEASRYYEMLWQDREVWRRSLATSPRDLEAWSEGNSPSLIYPDDLSDDEKDAYAANLERDYLRAFAGLRRVQLALNNEGFAASLLGELTAAYPVGTHGYGYAAMAQALVDSYRETGRLSDACAAAYRSFRDAAESGEDPGIDYSEVLFKGNVYYFGFYYANGHRYGSDPDNVFDVPDDIDGMISIPVCIKPD